MLYASVCDRQVDHPPDQWQHCPSFKSSSATKATSKQTDYFIYLFCHSLFLQIHLKQHGRHQLIPRASRLPWPEIADIFPGAVQSGKRAHLDSWLTKVIIEGGGGDIFMKYRKIPKATTSSATLTHHISDLQYYWVEMQFECQLPTGT